MAIKLIRVPLTGQSIFYMGFQSKILFSVLSCQIGGMCEGVFASVCQFLKFVFACTYIICLFK